MKRRKLLYIIQFELIQAYKRGAWDTCLHLARKAKALRKGTT